MQLELDFPEVGIETTPNPKHCEDSYFKEFEQGNFSHVLQQSKYSSKELLRALLTSENTREEVKISFLERMGRNIDCLEEEMNEEYKAPIREHNDKVRETLRRLFKKEKYGDLRKRGLLKFSKYNNFYRTTYGGKSFNHLSVQNPDHEQHEQYLAKRKSRIQCCISLLISSHLRNPSHIVQQYSTFFSPDEFTQAVEDSSISTEKKDLITKEIKKYTSEFITPYEFIQVLENTPIPTKQKDAILKQVKNILSQGTRKKNEE